MVDNVMKPTTKEFATTDQANYYSGITSIKVNGKNTYELKGKSLDDLHMNAFSGTNGEDAVEHIEYFLKIVDPIDLPNVNQDKLRVVVSQSHWLEMHGNGLTKLKDQLIVGTENYNDYINKFNDELEEPWDEDGVPYEIRDHIREPFRFKDGKTKWPTCNSNEDGFCNGGELSGMVRVGYMTYFQDHEWVWKSARYGVSKGLDTAYWGFLGVGTTFDIFQNIHILYLEYDVLSLSGYDILIFIPLWSLVSAGTDTPYLS
ncbi:hypothetical protein Tco_1254940 [Tanacetum coccineum]